MFSYVKTYREMHQADPKVFSGRLEVEQADRIAVMVRATKARTLLDYGSGKGYQYLAKRIHERWGGILPHVYDPGVIQIESIPVGIFDGVICTDVMEHIKPDDVIDTLADIFGRASEFVYLGICCRPAGKTFPDGVNIHLTVEPPAWWMKRIARALRMVKTKPYVWADYEHYNRDDYERSNLA